MEVEIISRETIKPSVATPSDKKNIRFCFLDQKHPPVIVPTLLFYTAPQKGVVSNSVRVTPLDIPYLKTCLSQTLSCFYPLAGRYETWGTCLCNDQGIPFIEARVNRPLRDVVGSLSSSDIDLRSFYPPKEELITSGIHLAIQINVFSCGGFAIGWYHTHKVTDAVSASTFLRHWAGLVTQQVHVAPPDFKAGAIVYPPVPEEDRLLEREPQAHKVLSRKRVVVRSFVFTTSALDKLKAEAANDKFPNPSRFTAVAGFVWQQILMASPTSKCTTGESIVYLSVDLRSRTDPALPKETMGNLVEMALARCKDKGAPVLSELVAELNDAISEMKGVASEYQGDKRSEAFEKHRQIFVKDAVIKYKLRDVYIITGWCKSAGFSDIDFGFGKPLWVVPTDESVLDKTDMVMILDSTDSNGHALFEAWVFLEDQHMKILQSNPHFLALASPRF